MFWIYTFSFRACKGSFIFDLKTRWRRHPSLNACSPPASPSDWLHRLTEGAASEIEASVLSPEISTPIAQRRPSSVCTYTQSKIKHWIRLFSYVLPWIRRFSSAFLQHTYLPYMNPALSVWVVHSLVAPTAWPPVTLPRLCSPWTRPTRERGFSERLLLAIPPKHMIVDHPSILYTLFVSPSKSLAFARCSNTTHFCSRHADAIQGAPPCCNSCFSEMRGDPPRSRPLPSQPPPPPPPLLAQSLYSSPPWSPFSLLQSCPFSHLCWIIKCAGNSIVSIGRFFRRAYCSTECNRPIWSKWK